MNRKFVALASLVAALGLASDAYATVGDLSGTNYGVSGRNYGDPDFGAGLLFASEYVNSDTDFTGDEQLSGVGSPVALTFDGDGTEKMVSGLAISETYNVYHGNGITGSNSGVSVDVGDPHGDGDGFGIFDVPIPNWDAPGHVFEVKIRDTLGNGNNGGGVNRDIFASSIIRIDDLNPVANTPNGGTAVPMHPADRDPEQLPGASFFSGQIQTWFFYYEKNHVAANSPSVINLGPSVDVLEGDHPILGSAQKVYYPVFNSHDFDASVSHDIGPGTMSTNVDTEALLGEGVNLVLLANNLGFDGFEDIDTVVFGALYHMIAEGDGNLDSKVDGLDYLLWAGAFGTDPVIDDGSIDPVPGGMDYDVQQGDYNKDGKVDGLDYLKWASNFGFVGDGSDTLLPASAVPEPTSLALACFALTGMGLSIRRRR
jgi:hypothetical protein